MSPHSTRSGDAAQPGQPNGTDESRSAAEDLAARITALEAENERLRTQAAGGPAPSGGRTGRAGRWRGAASAICIVLAAILVPVSIVTAWARVQLVDEESFVSTLAPLIDEPSVQDLVISETMDAIDAQVDFAGLTERVFDGIVELGLGPRAAAALSLLQQPAAAGLENLVAGTVSTVVRSDAFSDVWTAAVRSAHRAVTAASTSDGGGVVVLTSDGLGIQLGPIVEQVRERLTENGVAVASLIPAVDRVVIIGSGENLTLARTGYALAVAVGWWLPVLTLALLAAGIALARRRAVAVVGSGVALAAGGASLGVALAAGTTAVALTAGELGLSPSALDVAYRHVIASIDQTAWVLVVLGVFVAILGWLMGRSRAATGVRRTVRSLNASARGRLAERGMRTGAFGRWIGAHRVAVRALIAAAAVLWLFLLRPLGLGEVLLVATVSIAFAWVLELLQQRDEDTVEAVGTLEAVDDAL